MNTYIYIYIYIYKGGCLQAHEYYGAKRQGVGAELIWGFSYNFANL